METQTPQQPTPDADFYRSLRKRIRAWLEGKGKAYAYADLLLAAPDLLHLLIKLTADPRVPPAHKAALAGAVAYFISPLDFMAELVLGPIGLIDDIALAAYVLHQLINAGHGEIAQEHWAGDGDLLQLLQRIVSVADSALGSGLWQRLKRFTGRR